MVAALACGCADAGPTAPAGAAQSIHIDTYTPQGLRAKQVMDMLNSDWPIARKLSSSKAGTASMVKALLDSYTSI